MSSMDEITNMAEFRARREARKRGLNGLQSAEDMLAALKVRMKNMDHILMPLTKLIYRGLRNPRPNRVLASVLVTGMPASGKSQLGIELAKVLGGPNAKPYKIACGQFQDQTFKNGVFGAPPQYAGGEGLLTIGAVRELKGVGVVIIDEIEKPMLIPGGGYIKNSETCQSWYDVLGTGRYIDNHTQREVDCSKIVLIFTSNAEQEGASADAEKLAETDLVELGDRIKQRLTDKPFIDAYLDRLDIITSTRKPNEETIIEVFRLQMENECIPAGMRLAKRSELPAGVDPVESAVWDEAATWWEQDPAKRTARAFGKWIGQINGLDDSLDKLHMQGASVFRIVWDDLANGGKGGVRAVAVQATAENAEDNHVASKVDAAHQEVRQTVRPSVRTPEI